VKLIDRGLITQKSRDLFARSPNLTEITNYSCIGNLVDWVHRWWTMAKSHGPPWTGSGTDWRALWRSDALTRVGPSATPGHRSSPAGRKMEGGARGSCFASHQGSGSSVVAG
jgi:hypothetical protein